MLLYPRLGLPLALELVNTQFAAGGQPRDGLQTPAELEAWLTLNAPDLRTVELEEADLERFRELRAALRRLLTALINGSQPEPSDLQVLNEVCAASPRIEQLEWAEGGTPRLRIIDLADPATVVLSAVARSAIQLLAADACVGRCQAPGCVLFFTKDARHRHWCSAACGNRARVARHYVRHQRQTQTVQQTV